MGDDIKRGDAVKDAKTGEALVVDVILPGGYICICENGLPAIYGKDKVAKINKAPTPKLIRAFRAFHRFRAWLNPLR